MYTTELKLPNLLQVNPLNKKKWIFYVEIFFLRYKKSSSLFYNQ